MPLGNTPSTDERLNMKDNKLIRPEDPSDSKKGDMGICYKEFLAVRPVEVKNLNECLIFEVSLYRHLVKQKTSLTLF